MNNVLSIKTGRMKGTIMYGAGLLVMVVLRLSFIGFIVQIAGILLVFRDFLPWLKGYTFSLPFVGKYLSKKKLCFTAC